MKKVLVTGLAVFFLAAGFAWGQEERLTATLERETVSVGNPVYLNITFYGSKNISPPDLPQVEGLRIKYVGPATKISIVNGRVSQSIRHAYLVIPLEEGDFQIGPFEARYEGRVYEADPVVLIAREVPVTSPLRARKPRPASVSQYEEEPAARPYEGERAFIVMEVEKKEMYVNEVVPVTIKLYVDNLQLRDIEYPEFSHEGFSVGEMQKPERSMAVVRGLRYDALVFRRDIFGIKEGDYVLGPAQLRCKVLERVSSRRSSSAGRSIFDDDFFRSIMGRYQTYPLELRSKEIPVTILPFPKEGRPEDFRGAIGDFDMDVKVDPKKVKVGDPIVLRMTISGRGNLDSVTAPDLEETEDFKVYEPQVTIKGGKKIYEQVIIPKTDMATLVPGISFSFFDPKTGKYKTIERKDISVKALAQPEEEAVKVVSMKGMEKVFYPPEKLGEDIVHIKELSGRFTQRGRFLYQNWVFWAGQAIPIGVFLGFYAMYREKQKMRTDKGYARFTRAPKKARIGMAESKSHLGKNRIPEFYDAVFRTLQEYLADKFNLPIGSVTVNIIDEKFRPAGLDEDMLEMLKDVFSKCDMARYAAGLTGKKEAKEILDKTRRIIDYLERARL